MNYLVIPFFVILIVLFGYYLKNTASAPQIRECTCVKWCITLLFSLLGGVLSYHIYHYQLFTPLSPNLLLMLLLYLILTLLFILLSPSGYRRLFSKATLSPEELLYAEYNFNHSLEILRGFFFVLLLVIPVFFRGVQCLTNHITIPILLEESYLIGGLYFVSFCILFPFSLRQSIYWFRQLQRIPSGQEAALLQNEKQRLQYHRRNRKIY